MDGKIGVFDSGLGGLSILKKIIEILPNEDYIFYEDSIHNPYGEKSDLELLEITSKAVDYLLENDCKIIVIACNTATTACMKKLRIKYPNTIFVGTVPAIKVAYDLNCKSTIILSTNYTMKSERVKELISDYHRDFQDLINISGEDLAYLIENNNRDAIKERLRRILGLYKNKVDSIVLGCTHYSLIKEDISEVLNNVKIIDSCDGVAREVRHQLEKEQLLNKNDRVGKVKIVNNKSEELINRSFEYLYS